MAKGSQALRRRGNHKGKKAKQGSSVSDQEERSPLTGTAYNHNQNGPSEEYDINDGKNCRSKQRRRRKAQTISHGLKEQQTQHDVQRVARYVLLALIFLVTLSVASMVIKGERSPFHIQGRKKKIRKSPEHPANYNDTDSPSRKEGKAWTLQRKEPSDYDIIKEEETTETIYQDNKDLQRTRDYLTNYVCNDSTLPHTEPRSKGISSGTKNPAATAYCHPLHRPQPQRRTHDVALTLSNHTLKKGETVMVLPRHLQIWDLDAMRDPFVSRELFTARHSGTQNALDSGAFLAAFLVRKKLIAHGLWNSHDLEEFEETGNRKDNEATNQRIFTYLDILPTYKELQEKHPILWEEKELVGLFGKLTTTKHLLKGYQTMILSEFDAFCNASEEFNDNVDKEDYMAMRLNVISRSFGPGLRDEQAWLEEEQVGMHHTLELEEELEFYRQKAGIDLLRGVRAMSPILDTWDHHARPNVQWRYRAGDRAFVISVADQEIPTGQDIMVSYGRYTDTHLFSKFGFVNGDGSGYTEASLAIMHPLFDIGMGLQFSYLVAKETTDRGIRMILSPKDRDAQKRTMLNYLRYDDGYEECVSKDDNPDGYQLKLLKLRHLQAIANKYERWTIKIKPRDEGESRPSKSSYIQIMDQPPKFDKKKVKFDGSKVISTCRLIALTPRDYDGRAIEVLADALLQKNDEEDREYEYNFMVERQSAELEYRTLTCLARLTTGALELYPSSVKTDMESIASGRFKFQSKEWLGAQVRLGEMQTLEVLRSVAKSGADQMRSAVRKEGMENTVAMRLQRAPCPMDLSVPLLQETDFDVDL